MISTQRSLTELNTFGLESVADRYLVLNDLSQLSGPEFECAPALLLGGGSNLLLRERIEGLTVRVALGGTAQIGGKDGGANAGARQVRAADELLLPGQHDLYQDQSTDKNDPTVRLRVGAGVDWNQFVRYTLDRGWAGLENLILIPGTVGASPVQNIGAYGAEVAEFITAVHVWEYGVGARSLTVKACRFGYRHSRFKDEPDRYLITAIDFAVNRPDHLVRTDYGAIQAELERLGLATDPGPADVALAVTNIRRGKLPDWFFLGNCGSFFKNPIVPKSVHDRLLATYPGAPAYPVDADRVKLPAGWLIDRAGLRGYRRGNVGTYQNQALVVVNHGGAAAEEVLAFARFVVETVQEKFGVRLEREVR